MSPSRTTRTFALLAVVLLALGAAVLLLRPELSSRAPKPNILVILIDTLRADHLGYHGYERDTSPNIDKFARENLYFENAVSSSAWTPPSVASLFTGMYASVHGHMPLKTEDREGGKFSKVDESFHTMAELLREDGYGTALISANPLVGEKYGFSQGFDLFISPSPGREIAEKINKRAMKYLDEMRPQEKPFFLYLHYMDPHFTYNPPAPYGEMFSGPLRARKYANRELRYIGKYDGEIRYVDEQLGELFEFLKQKKLYDDLAIVLLSDHGEQFRERGHLGHADRLYLEETHIPLIVKAPRRHGKEKAPVSIIDVLPTVLEISGTKLSHAINGVSLLSALETRRKNGVFFEVVRHWNQKAFLNSNGEKILLEYPMERGLLLDSFEHARSEKLFKIWEDPTETNTLDDAGLNEALKSALAAQYFEAIKLRSQYSIGEIQMDSDTLDQLKSLGYL